MEKDSNFSNEISSKKALAFKTVKSLAALLFRLIKFVFVASIKVAANSKQTNTTESTLHELTCGEKSPVSKKYFIK